MRAAIYYAPLPGMPLADAAARWFGRDAFSGLHTRKPHPRIDALAREPARYGFHATLKAPFRLADGRALDELAASLDAFAATRQGFTIPGIALTRLGRFFALVPDRPVPALDALERDALSHFEPFRAPLSEAELARRRPEKLTPRQRELLAAWGYPYVLDEFRFHLTLTGPVAPDETPWTETMLSARFASFLGKPLAVEALTLFVEPEPAAPFAAHSIHSFKLLSAAAPA